MKSTRMDRLLPEDDKQGGRVFEGCLCRVAFPSYIGFLNFLYTRFLAWLFCKKYRLTKWKKIRKSHAIYAINEK